MTAPMAVRLLRGAPLALRRAPPISSRVACQVRSVQTLPDNPHVYVFEEGGRKVLTYAQSPRADLAIGTSPVLPPAPDSFAENPRFRTILQAVLKQHAHQDPQVAAEAHSFASNAGASLGSSGLWGASSQGGMGGGGRGGHVHVYDLRNPPDYGRIADSEDIFGSLEVDAQGGFVDGHGHYQESGTHRPISRNGLLKLTPFIREKLVERLKQESSSS